MPRIRTIKPEFWADEKLAPMDPLTRLVFVGLISMADDAGRLLDSVKQIDAMLFPLTDDSARESLAKLSRAGRIIRGTTASGQPIVQIVNWRHQKVDHPNFAAALPPIAQPLTDDSRAVRENGATHSSDIRDSISTSTSTSTNDLLPVDPSAARTGPDTADPRFAEFWGRYPARAGSNPKRRALHAWKARRKEKVSVGAMLAGLGRYVAYLEQEKKIGTEFVLQAATFLGPDRRFEEAWTATPAPLDEEDLALEARAAAERAAAERDEQWLAARRAAPAGVQP